MDRPYAEGSPGSPVTLAMSAWCVKRMYMFPRRTVSSLYSLATTKGFQPKLLR